MRSPASVSATTSTRVQASPRPDSSACSVSASDLAMKAARSTRSAGGSTAALTRRSTAAADTSGGSVSAPLARRCAAIPAVPKRANTSGAGRAANRPTVRRPRRRSTSTRSASAPAPAPARRSTCNGDRKVALCPGGTTSGVRPPSRRTDSSAAIRAVCGPSARPTPTGHRRRPFSPTRARRTRSSNISVRARSPPW